MRASELVASGEAQPPDRDASLTRLRVGVYADAATLANASEAARYLARVRAVALTRQSPVFARESALALHGVPYGLEPDVVFTAGRAATAHRKAKVAHASVELGAVDVTEVDGLLACSLAYALADFARRRGPLESVAAIDWALHRQKVTEPALLDALGRQGPRGQRIAAWAIGFADAGAESVGESWSRVRIHQLGFAPPVLQPWVTGASGLRHRADMGWQREGRRPLFGEFDGMQKYGAIAQQAGKSGAQALAEEKTREDDIRFVGDVARWVWGDLMEPGRLERILLAHGVPRPRRSSLATSLAA